MKRQFSATRILVVMLIAMLTLYIPQLATSSETSGAIAGETFTTYSIGRWVTSSVSKIQASEQYAASGEHQPWSRDPVEVASVMAWDLLPGETPPDPASSAVSRSYGKGFVHVRTSHWQVAYKAVDQVDNLAHVDVRINGRREFSLTLVKPFNYSWYVVDVVPLTKQAQARFALKPAGQMVALRDSLEKHGFQVNWKPEANVVSVQHGLLQRSLSLKGCVADGKRRDGVCRMRNVDGRILVLHALIAGLLAEDLMESLRSSGSAGS